MADSKECPTTALIFMLYVANTIMMYLSLQGHNWVNYQGGNSGLWYHCNSTHAGDESDGTSNETEDECHFIPMTDASVGLHHVRAFYIVGFIIWCLGMIQRYLTWQHRGTKVDRDAIGAAMLCGLFVMSAALLFNLGVYHWDYRDNDDKYVDPRFGVGHNLSFVGASLAILLGLLTIRHHRLLNSETSSFSWAKRLPCFSPDSSLRDCCSKRNTRPESTAQQTSRPVSRRQTGTETTTTVDVSVISTNDTESESNYSSLRLQHTLGILGAVFSVRRAAALSDQATRGRGQSGGDSQAPDTGDDVSVVSASGISEWSSRHSGGENNLSGRHMPPVDVMTLPPAYDEVVHDGFRRDNDVNLPPSYDEVIGHRGHILSPPPAYEESTS